MGVTNTLTAALSDFSSGIKNNESKAITQTTVDFARMTSESGIVPVKSGALRRSAMVTSSFNQGTIVWSRPYANRRHKEGSITGIALWDVVTWKIRKGTLMDNFNNYLKQF